MEAYPNELVIEEDKDDDKDIFIDWIRYWVDPCVLKRKKAIKNKMIEIVNWIFQFFWISEIKK